MKNVSAKIQDLLTYKGILDGKLQGYNKMIDAAKANEENNKEVPVIKFITTSESNEEVSLQFDNNDAHVDKLVAHTINLLNEGRKLMINRIAEVEKEIHAIEEFVKTKHDKLLFDHDEYKDSEELAQAEAERNAKAEKIAAKEAAHAAKEQAHAEKQAAKEAAQAEKQAAKEASKSEKGGHLDDHFDELEKQSTRKGLFK